MKTLWYVAYMKLFLNMKEKIIEHKRTGKRPTLIKTNPEWMQDLWNGIVRSVENVFLKIKTRKKMSKSIIWEV
jgi:hypothetical protein